MKSAGVALMITGVASFFPYSGGRVPERGGVVPSIDSQVVFLYYADLMAAAEFYENTLALEKSFDEGWVKIYRTSRSSFVGLVDENRGTHRAADAKPVMLSIVTREVDAWYEHLRRAGVPILDGLSDSESVPVRGFLVEDPGGYTVEFFEWREN